MGKGNGDERNIQIREAFAHLHGRLETEVERFSLATGVPLDDCLQRASELLHPMGRGIQNQVSALSLVATLLDEQCPKVERTGHAPSLEAHAQANGAESKPRAQAVSNWWNALSPAKKQAIINKRKKSTARTIRARKRAAKAGEQ